VDTNEIMDLLREVAQEVINPRFGYLADGQISEKGPGDLVTVADREAEKRITAELARRYPDAVILGEEACAEDGSLLRRFTAAPHAFTVDPLDGTKNFIRGSRDHAVMVAELRAGVTVRSWIWQPQHGLGYVAERGSGAWRNGTRLIRQPANGFPRLRTARREWLGQRLGELEPLTLSYVACGVDYPRLIEGDTDAILYRVARPWDHAPGSLLLTEAGGHISTFDAGPYLPQVSPNGLVAAADRSTCALGLALAVTLP
jgi:fructose-1,6-bisphosphatase/inositol monophosphatase family enzyme